MTANTDLAGSAAATDPSPPSLVLSRPRDGIALITLMRPDKRNPLSHRVVADLAGVFQACEADDTVRALVLTGGSQVFAAGSDLKEMAAWDHVTAMNDPRKPLWSVFRRFAKPWVAAVNGLALGGGCELAMYADLIVAGESARFGQPEINVGIMPAAGGTQLLTRAVGKQLAMKMILTGEPISAQEALAAGLVLEVCADDGVLDRALALATLIASKPPLAARLAKEAVLKAFDTALEAGIDHEFRAARLLWPTDDRREGFDAFLSRRAPVFTGR